MDTMVNDDRPVAPAVPYPALRLRGLQTQIGNFMRGVMPDAELRALEDITRQHGALVTQRRVLELDIQRLEDRETDILRRNGFMQ